MQNLNTLKMLPLKLIKVNRFNENHSIQIETLVGLANLARMSSSAANLHPLKYILVSQRAIYAQTFYCLKWAGYMKEWPGSDAGERPSAYMVVLNDTRISKTVDCDHGIAAQSIMLGAKEKGLAGCIIGAVNHPRLRAALDIADHLKILLVLALGKPKEQAVLDPVEIGGDIRYWRDSDQIHHVPKRTLQKIVIKHFKSE